ncbi:MAG: outer membrane beta-barrel family protein [Prolixibacteraceae bacterium]
MKHIFLLSFCLLFGQAMLLAQTGRISGVLADQVSKERIPFATISLLGDNNVVLSGTVSKNDGSFSLENVKAGNFKLVINFMGYKTDTIPKIVIGRQGSKLLLGTILLRPASIDVGEVQVSANAKTSVSKIDRQTYRAIDFETAKGGTATDLLSKLPSVSVDPDGSVSVRGTSDFMVYLNGKPTQMDPATLLGQISVAQIENIEVISVPTARYDAQGKGGIININTRKTGNDGLSVSVNGLIGGAPWSNLSDRYSGFKLNDNRIGGGVNLIYFKDKLTISGGINYNHRNINGKRIGDARILVRDGVYRHMVADGERPEWFENLSANFGLDYQLSKQSKLSGAYFFGSRTEGRSAYYIYDIFYADKNHMTVPGVDRKETWIYNPNTDTRFGTFQSGNIDYLHNFSKNIELRISAMYEHSGLRRELQNQNFQYNKSSQAVGPIQLQYGQNDDTPLDGYRMSVDYSTVLGNGSKLALGVQPQYFSIAGSFKYDTLDVKTGNFSPYQDLENGVDVTRGVYAAYADYSGNFKKLKYIAGLRVEYANQSVQLLSANYFSLFDGVKKAGYKDQRFDLFPNLHLEWELSGKDKLTLAASRRISRPPVKNLAPFLYRRHLEVYEVGDPELAPEYLLNSEISWERKIRKHTLGLTGFYRGVNNAIYRVNTITNENPNVLAVTKEEVLIRSYTNAGNSTSLGAELNANIDGGKYAKFFVGGSLYNYAVKGDIFGFQVNNSSLNWSLKSNLNLMFTKELKMAFDFNLKSATVTAQGKNHLFYMVNSAVSYTPAKLKGWDLSLRVLDLFNSNVEGLDTQAFNKIGKEIFYQETTYYRKGGIVELGLSYSFEKRGKSVKKTDSGFGKDQF